MTSGHTPSGKHWVIQIESLDDRVDVVRPQLRITLSIARFVGESMTSHVECDQSIGIRKTRVQLQSPLEPALRCSVDEKDGSSSWVTSLNNMESAPPPV